MNNIFVNIYNYCVDRYKSLNLQKTYLPKSEAELDTLKKIDQNLRNSRSLYNRAFVAKWFFFACSLLMIIFWPLSTLGFADNFSFFGVPVAISCLYFMAAIMWLTFKVQLSKTIFLKQDISQVNQLLNDIIHETNYPEKANIATTIKPYWKIWGVFQFNNQINALFYMVNVSQF